MQPFERLRHLARWSGDGVELVSEAADCLAGFADDPAGLVVACRRLLVHHPTAGPLWWLCARVLAAPDPASAAWDAWQRVHGDATYERVAELLPFPHDDVVAVLGGPELAGAVAATRPDLDVVAVRRRSGDEHLRARLARADASARTIDEIELAALEPSHLLVETPAADPTRAAVPAGTHDLVTTRRVVGWLVAGVGHVLPARLFASVAQHIEEDDERTPALELVDAGDFARIAGPTGLDRPDTLARRVDCPVAPELLRLGG
ncbi:MAG: hypothetical protein ACRDY4_10670 [Acidimicrobiia bacterium]